MIDLDYKRLLIKVARFYYEQNLTQADISERLRLSRQKVQRLLRQAHAEGLVQIIIHPITEAFTDLEEGLERHYGLREAVVVETSEYENQATVAREVGVAAVLYALRVVQPRDSIAISWGGTLLEMVNSLAFHQEWDAEGVTVIQALGGLGEPNNGVHAADLARRMARALGGKAVLLPAPGVAGTRRARDAFYEDPFVAEALSWARNAKLAFMGIGAPRQDSILVRGGTIVSWPEISALAGQGAVGDINLRYFDRDGRPVRSELDERVIGLALEEVSGIGLVVGVAGGSTKLQAIHGALVGKLVDVLITDHETAARLLAQGQIPAHTNHADVR